PGLHLHEPRGSERRRNIHRDQRHRARERSPLQGEIIGVNLERDLVWSSEEGVTWVALAAASRCRAALLELIYLSVAIHQLAGTHGSPGSHAVYRGCSVGVPPKSLSNRDEQTRKARRVPWVLQAVLDKHIEELLEQYVSVNFVLLCRASSR